MELLLTAPDIIMVGRGGRVAFDKMNQISHDKWSSSFKGWRRCAVVVSPCRRSPALLQSSLYRDISAYAHAAVPPH